MTRGGEWSLLKLVPNNQKGLVHILLVIFLLAGIALGVYLVQQKTNLLPKANFFPPSPPPPEVSLTLSPVFENLPDPVPLLQSEEVKQETKGSTVWIKPNYQVGDYIPVILLARSDPEEANLFVAKIKFDKELLEVISVDLPDISVGSQAPIADLSFVKNWVEQTFDQNDGTISLVGGVPSPGFKTDSLDYPGVMTLIIFQAKKEGTATISFTDGSQVLRNSDNENILKYKENTQVVIGKKKACDDAIGQSQLTGCLYDGKNFDQEDGQAPAGPILSSPVPDQAEALLQDWGKGEPNGIVGEDEFSARWAGKFSFKKGNYKFFVGADDGVRMKIDRAMVLDDWRDTSYNEREFQYIFTEGQHLIELEYYENKGLAKVSLRWEYQEAPPSRYVKITYPNGGERLQVRDKVAVKWEFADVNSCHLGWSTGPGSLNPIQSGFDPGPGVYEWLVEAGNMLPGDEKKIKLDMLCYKTGVGSVQDQSDDFFTVFYPKSGQKGDGNTDGKVNLIDMSVLLTDFNKEKSFREPIDMNGDGKINTFDFSLMRKQLIDLGVIKGQ